MFTHNRAHGQNQRLRECFAELARRRHQSEFRQRCLVEYARAATPAAKIKRVLSVTAWNVCSSCPVADMTARRSTHEDRQQRILRRRNCFVCVERHISFQTWTGAEGGQWRQQAECRKPDTPVFLQPTTACDCVLFVALAQAGDAVRATHCVRAGPVQQSDPVSGGGRSRLAVRTNAQRQCLRPSHHRTQSLADRTTWSAGSGADVPPPHVTPALPQPHCGISPQLHRYVSLLSTITVLQILVWSFTAAVPGINAVGHINIYTMSQ